MRRGYDDKEVDFNEVQKKQAGVNTEERILTDNLKRKKDEIDRINKDKKELQDKIAYILNFNDEMSKKIE